MITIGAVVWGMLFVFDWEICFGGVAGVIDVDIDEASDGKFVGVVSFKSEVDCVENDSFGGIGAPAPLLRG